MGETDPGQQVLHLVTEHAMQPLGLPLPTRDHLAARVDLAPQSGVASS